MAYYTIFCYDERAYFLTHIYIVWNTVDRKSWDLQRHIYIYICIWPLGHCDVCSSIYGFELPLWYLQNLLNNEKCRKSMVYRLTYVWDNRSNGIIQYMFPFNVHVGMNRNSISVSYIITDMFVCCNSLQSFSQSWVNGFIIRVIRLVPPVPDLPLFIGVLQHRTPSARVPFCCQIICFTMDFCVCGPILIF